MYHQHQLLHPLPPRQLLHHQLLNHQLLHHQLLYHQQQGRQKAHLQCHHIHSRQRHLWVDLKLRSQDRAQIRRRERVHQARRLTTGKDCLLQAQSLQTHYHLHAASIRSGPHRDLLQMGRRIHLLHRQWQLQRKARKFWLRRLQKDRKIMTLLHFLSRVQFREGKPCSNHLHRSKTHVLKHPGPRQEPGCHSLRWRLHHIKDQVRYLTQNRRHRCRGPEDRFQGFIPLAGAHRYRQIAVLVDCLHWTRSHLETRHTGRSQSSRS